MDHNSSQSTDCRWVSRLRRATVAAVTTLTLLAAVQSAPAVAEPESQLDFGTDMASRGLWSEALFRFRQAEENNPGDPRILNNIAVSLEALGLYEEALEAYRQAVEAAPSLDHAKRNYARFVEFYQSYRGGEVDEEGEGNAEGETADTAEEDEAPASGVEKAAEEPTVDETSDADEDEV